METTIRRLGLLRIICRRRYEKISNLAVEFGVSERTIRRDIDILSISEPIYTQQGKYHGGVYVLSDYNFNRPCFRDEEVQMLNKIRNYIVQQNLLSKDELVLFDRILKEYAK